MKSNLEVLSEKINNWLQEIADTDKIPETVKAIYIGIFEGENTYHLHIAGSNEFTPQSSDWTCNEDFEPQDKYFDSCIKNTEVNWDAFLNLIVGVIKQYITDNPMSYLVMSKHVAVGFDDGDIVSVK